MSLRLTKGLTRSAAVPLALLIALPAPAAGDGRNAAGIRGLALSGGEPANDVFGGQLYWVRRWKPDWSFGVGFDVLKYDFERPNRLVGVVPASGGDTPDTKVTSTMLSGWVERRFSGSAGSGLRWSWLAGLGLNDLDVDGFRGPTMAGGTFDIRTDADREIVVLGGVDLTWPFARRWRLRSGAVAERHLADWTVRDRVSGGGNVDDYSVFGLRVGVERSF